MKLITLNPSSIQGNEYLLDLQTAQIPGHRAYPYWVAKYLIASKQVLAIPDGIYACWMGKLEGIMGSQYKLDSIFQDVNVRTNEKLPVKLKVFPKQNDFKGKRVLCVLSHSSFGLGDLILSMPFLKIFAESLNIELGLSINSAGLPFFHEQSWLKHLYPELLAFKEFAKYDYYIEPAVDKMDVLAWIRSFLLKEIGETVFHQRFPSPELKLFPSHHEGAKAHLQALPKRDSKKKICLFNWETSSQKRNLPTEVWKLVLKSLQIMDYQVAVTRSVFKNDGIFQWLITQENVVDASSLVEVPGDLIDLVGICDLVVSPDTSLIHLAGGLRKRALCIFLKSANDLYSKAWLKGTYWPGKLDKLYPTVKALYLPHLPNKDLSKLIYQGIRTAAFGEDEEMIELYNNLLFNLRNQHSSDEIEEIFKRKNIDFKRLAEHKLKNVENATT